MARGIKAMRTLVSGPAYKHTKRITLLLLCHTLAKHHVKVNIKTTVPFIEEALANNKSKAVDHLHIYWSML